MNKIVDVSLFKINSEFLSKFHFEENDKSENLLLKRVIAQINPELLLSNQIFYQHNNIDVEDHYENKLFEKIFYDLHDTIYSSFEKVEYKESKFIDTIIKKDFVIISKKTWCDLNLRDSYILQASDNLEKMFVPIRQIGTLLGVKIYVNEYLKMDDSNIAIGNFNDIKIEYSNKIKMLDEEENRMTLYCKYGVVKNKKNICLF